MSATAFLVSEKIGGLGVSRKQTAEVSRVTLDFSKWLDSGEVIGSVGGFSLVVDTTIPLATAWQVDYPFDTTNTGASIADTAPLVLSGVVIDGGTKAQILLGAGTPGVAYVVSCLVVGTISGRLREVDFTVIVDVSMNANMISSQTPTMANTVTAVSGTVALATGTQGSVFISNAAAAPITITLPATPSVDQTINAADVAGNAGTYTITFVGSGGVHINNATTFQFTQNYASAVFKWTGTQWLVI